MIYLLIEEPRSDLFVRARFLLASADKEKVEARRDEAQREVDLAKELLGQINMEAMSWKDAGQPSQLIHRKKRELELEQEHNLPGKIMKLIELTYTIEEVPSE